MKAHTHVPLALLAALALIFAGCGGGGGDDTASTESGTIGVDGGEITISSSDAYIPNASLLIPQNATNESINITMEGTAPEETNDSLAAAAEQDGSLYVALVEYAIDESDESYVHPLYGPIFGATSGKFIGPAVKLEPSGKTFNKPLILTIPLKDISDQTDDLVPLMQSENGKWEVLNDYTIDKANGTMQIKISHFSVLRWIKNLIFMPSDMATLYASDKVQTAMNTLPQDTFDSFVESTVCEGVNPYADLTKIPGLPTLLDYLGFESTRIDSGHEKELETWVRDQYAEAREGTVPYHSITLAQLFAKALSLNNGDIFQALVNVHNTLRDNRDSPGVQDMIENYRGDGGDEKGARYHLFGMALYSFAYEYYMEKTEIVRETNKLVIGTEMLSPEKVATIEEGIVSGDIVSDTTEYAVDLQGAQLGRDLYREVRNMQIADLAEAHHIDMGQCGTMNQETGWAIYLITNYSSAEGGYLTVDEVGIENDPPLLSSYPGGGISPDVKAQMQRVDPGRSFETSRDAVQSVCSDVSDFFRPALATFVLKAHYKDTIVGIDTIFQYVCE